MILVYVYVGMEKLNRIIKNWLFGQSKKKEYVHPLSSYAVCIGKPKQLTLKDLPSAFYDVPWSLFRCSNGSLWYTPRPGGFYYEPMGTLQTKFYKCGYGLAVDGSTFKINEVSNGTVQPHSIPIVEISEVEEVEERSV